MMKMTFLKLLSKTHHHTSINNLNFVYSLYIVKERAAFTVLFYIVFFLFTVLCYNFKEQSNRNISYCFKWYTYIVLRKSSSRFPFLRDNTNERTVLCYINNKLKSKTNNKTQERND